MAPAPKRLRTVMAGKGTWRERWGTAINLHFEGNWMPLLVRLPELLRAAQVSHAHGSSSPSIRSVSVRLHFATTVLGMCD